MNKGSILILAHSNANGVIFLSKTMPVDINVYIHWDRKFEIPEEVKHLAYRYSNIKLINSRICTQWGGFSLWESMFIPMGEIFGNSDCESITVISESDVPLMSMNSLSKELNSIDKSLVTYGNARATELRKNIADVTNPYGMRFAIPGFDKANEIFGNKYERFGVEVRLSEFIGSQWCTILRKDFHKMCDYIKIHPNLIKLARTSLLTDEEIFPHLMEVLEIEHGENRRFIKWMGENPHPLDLEFDEVVRIIKSGQTDNLFGRKVKFSREQYDALSKVILEEW